ncbi:DUF3887 domain-containing protein [Streptomyces sp. NPDC058662]|uniref:DUF3887 domain-containing protein n=1 Tax=Streptomyces sp. NPDC058662 TaxID=3346583 RepID=UPI00364C3F5B
MVATPGRETVFGGARRRLGLVVPAVALLVSGVVLPGSASASVPDRGAAYAYAADAVLRPAVPALPDYERLALDTLDEVLSDDFAAVSARFDEELREQASPEFLATSWEDYQQAFGAYRSHGEPEQVRTGAQTVVTVPLRMARQPGEFRVAFNGDGQITGLYFLRPGVPVAVAVA